MVMGPGEKSSLNPSAVDKLATDGSNWPLGQATMLTFFESKNLLKHIDGTAIRPQPPPKFASTHVLTEEEEERVEKAEDRMDKFLAREGLVKSQVIISVAEPLALMLQKKRSAQEGWEALVEEMTTKLKMVITSIQRQLRNMRCSEEEDLRLHLDNAQDLFARLKEMGAKITNDEFMDIILASLPPSYEAVMNGLTMSLEECGKPLEPDSIIQLLKAQYDKKKTQSTNVEEAFVGTSKKKVTICTNCKKKGHTIENCWSKGGGKEGQGPKQKKRFKTKKQKCK